MNDFKYIYSRVCLCVEAAAMLALVACGDDDPPISRGTEPMVTAAGWHLTPVAQGPSCATMQPSFVSAGDGSSTTARFGSIMLDTRGRAEAECSIVIPVDATRGSTYAIHAVTLEGISDLPSGTQAELRATPRVQRGAAAAAAKHALAGPQAGAFAFANTFLDAQEIAVPCGSKGNLELPLRGVLRSNGGKDGEGSLQVRDVTIDLVQRPCP